MSARFSISQSDVLLVVDVQNDFCPGGALPVPQGDAIVPLINRLAQSFAHVALVQDWHPPRHISFASSHPGRKAYETVALPYGPQTLWPDHCIQGTKGAEFHPDLKIPHAECIIRKGYNAQIDSYSAFQENDRRTKTGLAGYLRERGLTRLFVAGLAYDFCVRYSAEDARAAGFEVIVVDDACRAIDIEGSMAATSAQLKALGIPTVAAASIFAA